MNLVTATVPLFATNAALGLRSLYATINGGGRTRYLYAPERVLVLASQQPPMLDITQLGPSQYQIGLNGLPGQTIILQRSPDLLTWQAAVTNTLSSTRWTYLDNPPVGTGQRFYRAVLGN